MSTDVLHNAVHEIVGQGKWGQSSGWPYSVRNGMTLYQVGLPGYPFTGSSKPRTNNPFKSQHINHQETDLLRGQTCSFMKIHKLAKGGKNKETVSRGVSSTISTLLLSRKYTIYKVSRLIQSRGEQIKRRFSGEKEAVLLQAVRGVATNPSLLDATSL